MGVHVVDEHPKEASESSNVKFQSSSSASRLASVPLRLFKSRSKSQSRVASAARSCWVPDGSCIWRDNDGHIVQLKDVHLLDVIEPDRAALQRLAISRLNDMNMGCHVELPKTENVPVHHSKRRPMLLRKKAATTNFFESKEKDKGVVGRGAVFGISLSQCVANDRMRLAEEDVRRQDHCEEVLSALRISLKDDEKSASSREGSQTDIRGPENQGSTESLTWLESSDSSDISSQRRLTSRGSTSSLYGGGGNQVPYIVDNCISFLENKGLHTLGLFRVSGSKKRIRQLREDLDNNPRLTFSDSSQPHDVAQLLKEFFRELPEPLLPRDLYRAFIEIQKLRDPQRRLEATRWLLYLLPVVHRDTLAALLSFLYKVAESSEDYHKADGTWVNGNKMNSSNLATVFGPNILRFSKGSSETFSVQSSERAQERSDVILTVRSLIDNHKALLQVPARDLDLAYRNLMTDDPELLNALLNRHMSNSGTETKKETAVESSSSQYHSETISDHQSAMRVMQKSAREMFFSKETSHSQSHYSPELDVRSRIRPLMFRGTGYGDHSQLDRVHHHQRTQLHLNTNQGSTTTEFLPQQYGVSASFTVTRASGGSSPVPELKIYESEQIASSRARRVPYGKVRHMTTPSYVSEEMSITITIPARKQTQRYVANESQSVMIGGLSSWSGSHTNLIQSAQGSSSTRTNRRVQVKSKTSGKYLCPPAPHEIWKRQEIIASEHAPL